MIQNGYAKHSINSESNYSYFNQLFYLLRSLSEVRSIVLVTDLPHSDELIKSIFDKLYEAANKGIPKQLELLCADVLSAIIEESEEIPSEILKKILFYFLKGEKHSNINSNITQSNGNGNGNGKSGSVTQQMNVR